MYNLPCNTIPISEIKTDTALRQTITDLDTLKYSIQQRGLIEPILVSRTSEGYTVVKGLRRINACLDLGMTEIKALIFEDLDPQLQRLIALEIDVSRQELQWQERAKAMRQLFEMRMKSPHLSSRFGKRYTQVQFAHDLHLSTAHVSNFLGLAEMLKTHPEIERYNSLQKALNYMRQVREGIIEKNYQEERIKESYVCGTITELESHIKPIYDFITLDIKDQDELTILKLCERAMNVNCQIILFCQFKQFGKILEHARVLGFNVDEEPYFWRPKSHTRTEIFMWLSKDFTAPPRTLARSNGTSTNGIKTEFSQDKPYDLWYYFLTRLSNKGNNIFAPYCYSINLVRAALDSERNIFAFNPSLLIYERVFLAEFDHDI